MLLWGAVAFGNVPGLQVYVVQQAERYTPHAVDVASGLNIAAFNLGIAGAAWAGGLVVTHLGLIHTGWIGALVVLVALALTAWSGRLDRAPLILLFNHPKDIVMNSLIPAFGLGTFRLKGQTVIDSVRNGLDLGYRLVDTAQIYGNEADVGQAIAESGVAAREALHHHQDLDRELSRRPSSFPA